MSDRVSDCCEEENTQRIDEAVREERWTAFVARARELGARRGWARLLKEVAAVIQRGHPSESQGVELWLAAFAEEEGWPGVVSAIARAMRTES